MAANRRSTARRRAGRRPLRRRRPRATDDESGCGWSRMPLLAWVSRGTEPRSRAGSWTRFLRAVLRRAGRRTRRWPAGPSPPAPSSSRTCASWCVAIERTSARPMPLPRRGGAGHAVEAVEHAIALLRGNAGPVVADDQHGARPVSRAGVRPTRRPGRPQANSGSRCRAGCGPVRAARLGLAIARGTASRAFQAEVDVAPSASGSISSITSRTSCGRSTGSALAAAIVLLARQRQQLLDQAGRPCDAGFEPSHGLVAVCAGRRRPQRLHLQVERRQRRAQLVRRIGDERALALDGLLEPGQQVVQRRTRPAVSRPAARRRPAARARRAGGCAVRRRSGRTGRDRAPARSRRSAARARAAGTRTAAIVRSARRAARCSRTFIGCATWITRPRASTPNTRQRPFGVSVVDKPSVVSPGSTVWGRER